MALNIGSGSPITIGEVAAEVDAHRLGGIVRRRSRANIAPATSGIALPTSAAQQRAGIQAADIRFADGIAELVEWLRSQVRWTKRPHMVHELTALRTDG